MVVDDDPASVLLTQEALAESCPTIRVHSLLDGTGVERYLDRLRAAGQPLPSVLLLDLSMPGMDGSSVLARLRAHPEYRSIPVVVLTASSSAEARREAMDHGAEGFITKPDTYAQLVHSVQRACRPYLS